MTSRLHRSPLRLVTFAAVAVISVPGPLAAQTFRDVPAVLTEAPAPPLAAEGIILPADDAGPVPGGGIAQGPVHEMVAAPPGTPADDAGLLDVSARPFEGMLIDDSALDEMPYEASSGRWFWNGGWYVGGESMWMGRGIGDRRTVGLDTAIAPLGVIQFKNVPGPFGVAPGARVTIGKSLGRDYLDRDRHVEFIYYGGFGFDQQAGWNSVEGGNSIVSPLSFGAPGFNGASTYSVQTASGFNSWELNYKLRRRLGRDQLVLSPNGNWTKHAERGWLPALILGIRTAQANEKFSLTSGRTGVPASTFGGRYDISTNNWLLGFNIGAELISQNEFFYWGIRGRAAPSIVFGSTAQQAVGVNNTPPTQISPAGATNFTDSGTGTGAGFIGDLTLMAGWQIKPNFALQVGYDFLWIAGIATADRQYNLANIDTEAVNLGGQSFLNGLSFGFTGSW